MRVAQLTLIGRNYNYNFGAVLQAYALHHILALDGHQVELIDYVPTPSTLLHRLRYYYRRAIIIANEEGPTCLLRKIPAWLSKKIIKKLEKTKDVPEIPEFRRF